MDGFLQVGGGGGRSWGCGAREFGGSDAPNGPLETTRDSRTKPSPTTNNQDFASIAVARPGWSGSGHVQPLLYAWSLE